MQCYVKMDPPTRTVEQLKQELKKIGAKTSGIKSVLQERLLVWNNENLDRLLVDATVIPPKSEDKCPDDICFKDLKKFDKKHFSFVSLMQIQKWFQDRSANAGLQKGRGLFLNKFLKSVMCCPSLKGDFFMKGVCAAQTKTKEQYNVQLQINNAELLQATCGCPAGAGLSAACKHVAALAFSLEHYSLTGELILHEACTSKLQSWHKPTSGRCLEKCTVNEMLGLAPQADEPQPNDRTAEMVNLLINNKCSAPILVSRKVNASAYMSDHDYCKTPIAIGILDAMNQTSPSERCRFEEKTRGQGASQLWFDLRRTRITASIAGNIVKTVRVGNFAPGYARRQVETQKELKTAAITWGKCHEKVAIEEYCKAFNDTVTSCGIFIDTERSYIGASPDGMIKDANIILEVKCPYSIRNQPPECASCLVNVQGNHYELKKTHNYHYQCQIQMHVTKVHRCDFIVWTEVGLFVQHIKYDKVFCEKALMDIDKYYAACFAPICVQYLWGMP